MRPALLLVVLLALLLAGCASPSEDVGPADHVVRIPDLSYAPTLLEIAVGDVVEWRNDDDVRHTVTATDERAWGTAGSGSAEDAWLGPGDTWAHRFDEPGTFDYYCIPHGNVQSGRIVVAAPAPSA